jgi:hypothetical protein
LRGIGDAGADAARHNRCVATKKVRRRRAKLQRHEYELVVENEEGEEVPLEHARDPGSKAGGKSAEPAHVDRRGRTVQKPSLQRTLKRSAIFLPLIVVLVFALGQSLTTQQKLVQAIFLVAIFIPFSHFMDMLMWRTVQKRQAKQPPRKR